MCQVIFSLLYLYHHPVAQGFRWAVPTVDLLVHTEVEHKGDHLPPLLINPNPYFNYLKIGLVVTRTPVILNIAPTHGSIPSVPQSSGHAQ